MKNNLGMEKQGTISITLGATLGAITTTIDGAPTSQTNLIRAPTKPGRPSMVYSSGTGTLSWAASGTQGSSVQLTYINYEVYFARDNVNFTSIVNIVNSTSISRSITVGTYYIKAKNYYNQYSVDSDPYTITQPSITITTTNLIYNDVARQYKVYHTISDINGTASISATITDGTHTTGGNNSFTLFTFLNSTTTGYKTCDITVTDSLNLSDSARNTFSLSVTFNSAPTINLDTGTCEIVLPSPTNVSRYTYSWSSSPVAAIVGVTNTKVVSILPKTVTFSCIVTEVNAHGFEKSHPELTVSMVRPTNLGDISFGNITFDSFNISWTDLGTNGDPLQSPTVHIYYSNSYFSKDNLSGISSVDVTSSVSPRIIIVSAPGEYFVRLVKEYTFYGIFESNLVSLKTRYINPINNLEIRVIFTEGFANISYIDIFPSITEGQPSTSFTNYDYRIYVDNIEVNYDAWDEIYFPSKNFHRIRNIDTGKDQYELINLKIENIMYNTIERSNFVIDTFEGSFYNITSRTVGPLRRAWSQVIHGYDDSRNELEVLYERKDTDGVWGVPREPNTYSLLYLRFTDENYPDALDLATLRPFDDYVSQMIPIKTFGTYERLYSGDLTDYLVQPYTRFIFLMKSVINDPLWSTDEPLTHQYNTLYGRALEVNMNNALSY